MKSYCRLAILVMTIILLKEAALGSDPYGLTVTKKASANEVYPDDWINYTIYCHNTGSRELTGVQIRELYPQGLEVVSMSPTPDSGTNNQWTVDTLSPRSTVMIAVNCRLVRNEVGFSSEGRVEGMGFLNINNHLSNRFQSGSILNQVVVTSDQMSPVTASSSAQIAEGSVEVDIRKSGTGVYAGHEESKIGEDLSYQGSYVSSFEPSSTPSASSNEMNISSRWKDGVSGKNRMAGMSISEEYQYITSMNRSLDLLLNQNSTNWETESEFEGLGHFGLLQRSERSPSVHMSLPTLESENDLMGRFKINYSLEGHNTKIVKIDINQVPASVLTPQVRLIIKTLNQGRSSISYSSSASGTGFISGLDKLGSSQLSSVSGTGDYESSAAIRTQDSYLSRSLSLLHRPSSFMIAEPGSGSSEWCNQSLKWSSRILSGNNKNRFLGAEISYADQVNETVEVTGLNYISLDANFSGQASFRTISEGSDYEQDYLGDYSIKHKVSQRGLSGYDQPHLALGTGGCLLYLPNRTLAQYAIEIKNDGNCQLEEIEVLDAFPEGAEFVNSSQEHSELSSSEVKWTADLGTGKSYYIVLLLDVTKSEGTLKNAVSASCENSSLQVINVTLLNPEEVTWPSNCRMVKNAWLDPDDQSIIWYSINISNLADVIQNALLKDILPAQTALMNCSVDPDVLNGREVSWSFQLQPHDDWTVIYRVAASGEGSLTNYAQAELRPLDGFPLSVAYSEADVQVGSTGAYSSGEWQPPDWGWNQDVEDSCDLNSSCYLESSCCIDGD